MSSSGAKSNNNKQGTNKRRTNDWLDDCAGLQSDEKEERTIRSEAIANKYRRVEKQELKRK
jgi:hypothetical protein